MIGKKKSDFDIIEAVWDQYITEAKAPKHLDFVNISEYYPKVVIDL